MFLKPVYVLFYIGIVGIALIAFLITLRVILRLYFSGTNSVQDEKRALCKFFLYSLCFLIISGLPMFFFPDGRIMNVTALGMGMVYACSFFIVLYILRENRDKDSYLFNKKELLCYLTLLIFALFVLSNGKIFKGQYTSPLSPYNEANLLQNDIGNYVGTYFYFKKYGLTEQPHYLFNKLVSKGLVDKVSGKLIMERVKSLFPRIAKNICIDKKELYDFQPSDGEIYPITKP